MSWHVSAALMKDYENSLCSQVQEAEYSADTCSDGKQSVQLSANPTPQAYLCSDRMTAFSRLSRFGMTFAPLTGGLGEDLLTWFLADSRVRTSVQQETAQELTENDPVFGEKWHELSEKYDLNTHSWKIHLSLFPEDLPWSSVILPKWGMTRNGALFQHPTLERPISGTGFGLWQTPVSDDACNRKAGKWNSRGEPKLSAQVLLGPTPRSCSAMSATITQESAWKENRFPNLETVVGRRMWPTPTATDYKGAPTQETTARRAQESARGVRLPEEIARTGLAGQMNPNWVEWLMGWPLGWTDLKPLAMARFVEWQQQHSVF